jgi:hypothetical protein
MKYEVQKTIAYTNKEITRNEKMLREGDTLGCVAWFNLFCCFLTHGNLC